MERRESKEVKLQDNPFLLSLTEQGLTYQGASPDKSIVTVAVRGYYDDWAAYYETPWTPFGRVAEYGDKLPEEAAAQLFPEWAKRLSWYSNGLLDSKTGLIVRFYLCPIHVGRIGEAWEWARGN